MFTAIFSSEKYNYKKIHGKKQKIRNMKWRLRLRNTSASMRGNYTCTAAATRKWGKCIYIKAIMFGLIFYLALIFFYCLTKIYQKNIITKIRQIKLRPRSTLQSCKWADIVLGTATGLLATCRMYFPPCHFIALST